MALLDIPLGKIDETDLQRLITNEAAESLYIDYKRQSYGGSDSDRAEFLADISSFANTSGGDLVIGMVEDKGVPTAFSGLQIDVDAEKRRLEEIARGGLEPRVRNISIHAIRRQDGTSVLIVRMPRSYAGPHRVTLKGRSRFYARASSGKYEPNVEELRGLFTGGAQLADRVRAFRAERLLRIAAGETPVPLAPESTKVVLHVVPAPAFSDARLLDLVSTMVAGTHVPLPPRGSGGGNQYRVNLDGFVNYTSPPPGVGASYAQFFRNGIIEGVAELSRRREGGGSYFVGPEFSKIIVAALRQYLSVLESYDTGLPVYALISLCNAGQCRYRYIVDGTNGWNDTEPLLRDMVALPELYIDSFSPDVPATLRPIFNILWNAFGFLRCDMYDEQGGWKGG